MKMAGASLNTLKMLLGVTDNSKDDILTFTMNKVTDMVLNYCNIDYIPDRLDNVLINMCIDMYRAESLGQEELQGPVKSITEGDVSVSFGNAQNVSDNPGMEFLKNYTLQLDRFRKARW